MFRYLCAGIAVAAVLALAACGQPSAAAPTPVPSAPTRLAMPAPTARVAPTMANEPSSTALHPAVTTVPAPGEPTALVVAQSETVRGVITSFHDNQLQLNTINTSILLDSATQVLVLSKPVAFINVAVGRNVTILAARNSQGQLIAQQITLEPQVPARPRPPK